MGIFDWFKSKMFKGRIIETVGEIQGEKTSIVSSSL
jgi:hypothetical protein